MRFTEILTSELYNPVPKNSNERTKNPGPFRDVTWYTNNVHTRVPRADKCYPVENMEMARAYAIG